MSLICGSNASMDAITEKVDEIKAKLAEGMSALGDLESKAGEALSQLQAAMPEIPAAGPSLQADLSGFIASAQADLAGATASFQATWGEALSSSEIQGYIDKITTALSDPLSLASFDPCSEFPNKELDAAGKEITKAQEAAIPNVAPIELPSFDQITTKIPAITLPDGTVTPEVTITGPTTLDLSSLVSSVSPAGTSRSNAGFSGAYKTRGAVLKTINDYFTPKVKAARLAYEKEKKKPEFGATGGSGINGSGAAKRDRLYKTGKMSAGQAKWYVGFLDAEIEYHNVQGRRDHIKDQLIIYIEVLTGRVSQENFDKGEKAFKEDYNNNIEEVGGTSAVAADFKLYEDGKAELDKNKADFAGVGAHTNAVVSTATQ